MMMMMKMLLLMYNYDYDDDDDDDGIDLADFYPSDWKCMTKEILTIIEK